MKTPNRLIRAFAGLVSGLALLGASGCSLQMEEQARVRVSFPAAPAPASALPSPLRFDNGSNALLGTAAPSTLDEFTCFGINVTGPEISVNPAIPSCGAAELPYPGVIGGLAPVAGGSLEVLVPSGAERVFQLFAVQSRGTYGCPAITDAVVGQFGGVDIDVPVEIGRVTANVFGDTTLEIKAAYDPAAPKPMFCPSGKGVPAKLALTGAAAPMISACTPYTVSLQDKAGGPAMVPYDLALALSGVSGSSVYLDSSCTSGAGSTSLTIPANQSAQLFYLKFASAASVSLGVSGAGLTEATLAIAIGTGPAATLAFATQPSSGGVPGTALAIAPVVSVSDSQGNPASGSVTVSLAAFSDAGCTAAAGGTLSVATNPVASSAGQAAFSNVAYSASGTIYLKASASGLPSICSNPIVLTASVASPAFSSIVGSGPVVADGSAASIITITLRDSGNNPLIGIVPTFQASGTGNTYSACSATDVAGASTCELRSNVVESKTLNLLTPISLTGSVVSFTAGPASQVQITSAAQTVAANVCSAAVTLLTQDAFGNISAPDANLTVNLSASSAQFFSDSGCAAPVSSIQILAGSSSGSFYVRSSIPGVDTLMITPGGYGTVSQPLTITADGIASQLAFSTLPGSGTAGQAFSVTVSVQDVNSVTVTTSTLPITLSAYLDPGCTILAGQAHQLPSNVTAAINPLHTAAGVAAFSNVQVSYAGVVYLGARAPGLPLRCSSAITFAQSPPVSLAILGEQQALANQCSHAMVVRTLDTMDSPVDVGASMPITLSDSSGGGLFYGDSACTTQVSSVTVAASTSYAKFWYRNPTAKRVTFSLSSGGLIATRQFSIINSWGDPTRAEIEGPMNFPANSCSGAFLVTRRDGDNNPISTGVATFSLSSIGSAQFFSDPTCLTPITQLEISDGAMGASYYVKSSMPGLETLFVDDINGIYQAKAELVAVTDVGVPTQFVFLDDEHRQTRAGNCRGFGMVALNDGGLPVPVSGGATFSLSGSGMTFYTDHDCLTPVSSSTFAPGEAVAMVTFRPSSSGIGNFTADGSGSGLPAVTLGFNALASIPSRLQFTGASSINANECVPYTVSAVNDGGTPVGMEIPTDIELQHSLSGSFYSDAACAASMSSVLFPIGLSSTTVYFKTFSGGSGSLHASGPDLWSGDGGFPISVAGGPATRLGIFGPEAGTVNVCAGPFSVVGQDFNGVQTNVTGTVTANLSSGSGSFFSDAACTALLSTVTVPSGSATSASFYFMGTIAAIGHLQATDQASVLGEAYRDFVVASDALSAAKVAINGSDVGIVGQCQWVRAMLQDSAGIPVNAASAVTLNLSGGANTVFYADSACSGAAVSTVTVAAGSSLVGFHVKNTIAQIISVTVSGSGLTAGSWEMAFGNEGAPIALWLDGWSETPVNSCAFYQIRAKDGHYDDAPVPTATTVSLTDTNSSGDFYQDPSCTTPISFVTIPVSTAVAGFYYRSSVSGSFDLQAYSTGMLQDFRTVNFNPSGGSQKLVWTGPDAAPAGACAGPLTIELRNGDESPANAASAIEVALSAAGLGSFYSDSGCTTVLSSAYISGGTSISGQFYYSYGTAGAASLTAHDVSSALPDNTRAFYLTSGGAPTQLSFEIPGSISAGSCHYARVVLRDSVFLPTYSGTSTDVTLGGLGSAQVFTDGACTTALGGFLTLPPGVVYAGFFIRDSIVETLNLNANASGLTGVSFTVNVTSAP
ncbi:MAG: Ig-like domain-containing protein [Oligoflexia bacterium]|nr:Ig-like domain-containing protein [Oligoflexia bacterium]